MENLKKSHKSYRCQRKFQKFRKSQNGLIIPPQKIPISYAILRSDFLKYTYQNCEKWRAAVLISISQDLRAQRPNKDSKRDFSGAPPRNDRTHILSQGPKLFFRGCKCSVFRPNFWTEFLLALSMLLATTQRHVPTSDFDPILRVPS